MDTTSTFKRGRYRRGILNRGSIRLQSISGSTGSGRTVAAATRQGWEDVAEMDPFWGVLSYPERRFGRWDADGFFATGELEIAELMRRADSFGLPGRRVRALDFGSGLGRLTRALAGRFEQAYGIDVSHEMVARARKLTADVPGCTFVANETEDLRRFPDDHFDLIYTRIVLQHLSDRRAIKAYVAEFGRTLRSDGFLVFQVLTHIPLRRRLEVRQRAYTALCRAGISRDILYRQLRLMPYGVTHIPEREVRRHLDELRLRTLSVDAETLTHSGIESRTFYVTASSRPR